MSTYIITCAFIYLSKAFMHEEYRKIEAERQPSLSKYDSSLWGREFLTGNSKLQLKLLHKTFNISPDREISIQ
jgi:hypothetical protein